jgi:uncharacterized DUF497 family protein
LDLDHATQHGVSTDEIERVIFNAEAPYPEQCGDEKFLVIGRGAGGRFVQVVFVVDEDGPIYPIHARPLNDRVKRRLRRRIR